MLLAVSDSSCNASTLCMSRLFVANNGSNLLSMFVENASMMSGGFLPCCMLISASSADFFLAFFLSFTKSLAMFLSKFLAFMRNFSDCGLVFASSECSSDTFLVFRSADGTRDLFASVSKNFLAHVVDSSSIAFLDALCDKAGLAIFIFSTFEDGFGIAFARFLEMMGFLMDSLDSSLSSSSADDQCVGSAFRIFFADSSCNFVARDKSASAAYSARVVLSLSCNDEQ
jgi:hypothetical protein